MIGVGLAAIPKDTHASPITYAAFLDKDAESTSNGTGFAVVTFDLAANSMHVQVLFFQGLTSGTTASHIHSPTTVPGTGNAGVATTTPTFPGFPLGVTSGSYDQTFDMSLASSYNPAYIALFPGTGQTQINNAEAALAASLAAGTAYLNIHTTVNPGGEIRGFLAATPEPGTFGLMAVGGLALLLARRKLRARS
jgi:hypothetical protein